METKPLPLRIAFLRGFYDGLDAMENPSDDLVSDPDKFKAWKAGKDHWTAINRNEQQRLEEASNTGDGFPDW